MIAHEVVDEVLMEERTSAASEEMYDFEQMIRVADGSRRQAECDQMRLFDRVDRLRRCNVPWREILFAFCRARGLPAANAARLAASLRKKLHDHRRGCAVDEQHATACRLRYRVVEEITAVRDGVIGRNGKPIGRSGAPSGASARCSKEVADGAEPRAR
jgi:hypothetical protein